MLGTARVDLLDPYLYAGDPEPVYAWLRDEAPVYRDEANGLWGVSRYRDVMAIERDTRRYSSGRGSRPLIEMTDSMINKDDPRHSCQRRLVANRFTPAAVRSHEGLVRSVVTELIDRVAPTGEAEVVTDIAAPLPATVIAELLGFGRGRADDCRRWSEVTMSSAGFLDGHPDRPEGSIDAVFEFAEATLELMARRRAEPQDDLISAWVHAGIDGEPLDDGEIVQEALLLLDGGAETTRSVIGQTVLALIDHPDQAELLGAQPSLLRGGAVEEFIRWATPILNMRRTVTEDHDLHGARLRAGDQVLLMYGAANRDPRAFEHPERFDVARSPNHHVSFGFGSHFCLGANLARLELRVLFEELLRRVPGLHLAGGEPPAFVPGHFTRTLRELHVRFRPERGQG